VARAQSQPPPTSLPPARVEAAPPAKYALRLEEFQERRNLGIGKFFDWTFFEPHEGRPLGSLLISRVPGIRTRKDRGIERIIGTRDAGTRNGRPCFVQTIVNGVINPEFNVATIDATEVIGFEYYTVAATPLKYNRSSARDDGAQCGTAVFWLK
jgi:hypothetical protein